MSHAIPDDATGGASLVGITLPRQAPAEPVSWRLALLIVGGSSTAGWIGAALALRQLIG